MSSPKAELTCEACIALAGDHLDGLLERSDAARYEAHIAVCGACARYHSVLLRGLDIARHLPVIEPSADFEAKLHIQLRVTEDELAQHQTSVRSGVAVTLGLAAVVALVSWSPLLAPARGVPGSAVGAPTARSSETSPAESWNAGGGGDWFVGAVPMRPFTQPSATNAFPGPYSPLLVDPPLSRGRAVLAALIRAE